MQTGSSLLVRTLQSQGDWSEQRERRNRSSRRAEDTPTRHPAAGPSLGFLTQVVNQAKPYAEQKSGGYAPARWACGVCADERA